MDEIKKKKPEEENPVEQSKENEQAPTEEKQADENGEGAEKNNRQSLNLKNRLKRTIRTKKFSV